MRLGPRRIATVQPPPDPNRPLPAPQEAELGAPKPLIAEASRAAVATPQASAADADDARELIQSPL